MINSYKIKTLISKIMLIIFRTTIILGLSYVILYPIINMIVASITHPLFIGKPNSVWIPLKTSTVFISMAFELLDFSSSLINTIIFAFILMVIQVFVSALTGYGFAKLKFKGSNLLFFGVLLTIVVPPQALILPQYFHFKEFDVLGILEFIGIGPINLLGKKPVLYIMSGLGMGLRSGLFIFIFRQFFKGLPKELEEAALIDGCGHTRTFFKIMLPNATSAALTVSVFSFVWNFGDNFYTKIFYGSDNGLLPSMFKAKLYTPNYITDLYKEMIGISGNIEVNPIIISAVQNAGKLLFIAPLLILYFIIQRRFVRSFERSGIVG